MTCGFAASPMTRICSLAGPTKVGDDHGDDGIADVFAQRLLELARQLRRRLAARQNIVDQRSRHLAVGPHRHGERQLRIAPYDDIERIERPDDIVMIHRREIARSRRIRRRTSGDERAQRCGKQNKRQTGMRDACASVRFHHCSRCADVAKRQEHKPLSLQGLLTKCRVSDIRQIMSIFFTATADHSTLSIFLAMRERRRRVERSYKVAP